MAPAASVPPADDNVTHDCVFVAVQAIEAVPVFVTVYDWLGGLNGPPAVPDDVRFPADTVIGPATGDAVTVKELVNTFSWPWFGLVGSGVQFGPKEVVPPLSAMSYLFPYQAAVKVYVPAVAGAVPVIVIGKAAPPPIPPVEVPVLLVTSTPF